MRQAMQRAGLVLALLLATAPIAAAFDLQAYRDHLQQVRTWTGAQLIESRAPYGPYRFQVPPAPAADWLDSVTTHYGLTPGELELLGRHDFVVSERLTFPSYGEAFEDVWRADLPVFVSADAILHALHRSYVEILAAAETQVLSREIGLALDALHGGWPALRARYAAWPGLQAPLADVDVYLTVARSLLAGSTVASEGGHDAFVAELLGYVRDERPLSVPLFNDAPRLYDFSQMKPRGHYTRSVELQRYFQAMMWLGRTEMRLTEPPGEPRTPDVSREIVAANLVRELADATARRHLQNIEAVLQALIGTSDNVTLAELDRLAATIGLHDAAALLEAPVLAAWRAELATGGYSPQAINSQILIADPMRPDETLDPPSAFLLLGQRFILDSYVAWNVVYDRIEHQGRRVFRGLPSPLDVLYAVGNDDVLPLLAGELDAYHYAPNLSALRALIDGYEPEYWDGSLYTTWLQAIRTLAHTGRQAGAPEFMRTGAWQQEKMNTQLASWAELRHDHLLYAKQAYTGGTTCSYPRGYVEPVPALYATLQAFAARARSVFGQVAWTDPRYQDTLDRFFDHMQSTMATLTSVAGKQLSGEALSEVERQFLAEVLVLGFGCGDPVESGWYPRLFFSFEDAPARNPDRIVADVHTQPTDAAGNPVGYVLHVATGAPQMGVFIAASPGQPRTAFVGPVAAYYEHLTSGFTRMTDEEWQALYAAGPPPRPDWTHVYLADAEGLARSTGRRLVTADDPTPAPPPAAAARLQLAPNVPNPFNPSTLLGVRIDLPAPQRVRLAVYDARGRLVRVLLHEVLPSGNYHVRWNGDDGRGRPVGSGVYWAHVTAGSLSASRRMVLLE